MAERKELDAYGKASNINQKMLRAIENVFMTDYRYLLKHITNDDISKSSVEIVSKF